MELNAFRQSQTVTLRHFYDYKGELPLYYWSSPNMADLPLRPPKHSLAITGQEPITDFRRTRWMNELYPWLAFMPVRDGFDGPLFSRLLDVAPLESNGGRWRMNSELAGRWKRLECNLLNVSELLSKRASMFNHSSIFLLPLPSSSNFSGWRNTQKGVYAAMRRGRICFVFLMAYCSLMVAMNTEELDKSRRLPKWAESLISDGTVNASWMANFCQSIVCDFTPGLRVGSYINAFQSRWGILLRVFQIANVPIWIWWGPLEQLDALPRSRLMRTYIPNEDQKRHARLLSEMVPAESSGFGGPLPYAGSSQQQGENHTEFRHRTSIEADIHFEHKEDHSERDTRIANTKTAERENWDPNVQVPSVGSLYEWLVLPDGWEIRKPLERRIWAARWQSFRPENRLYIPYLNQWDLGPVLEEPEHEESWGVPDAEYPIHNDPDVYFEDGDYDIGDFDSVFPEIPLSPPGMESLPTSAQSVVPYKPLSSLHADYAADITDMASQPSAVVGWTPGHISLREVLETRLGLRLLENYSPNTALTSVQDASLNNRKTPKHLLLAIGLWNYFKEEPYLQNFMNDVVRFISAPSRAKLHAPYFLYQPSLLTKLTEEAEIEVWSHVSQYSCQAHSWQQGILLIYGIKTQDIHEQWWVVGLWDYTTMLQLVRHFNGRIKILESVRYLLSWGIPFLTLKPLSCEPQSEPDLRPCPQTTLGYRPHNYQFTLADFNEYEERKRSLLSTTIGRVALMRGGIYWRLAQDVISNPNKLVTKGPDLSDVTKYGKVYSIVESESDPSKKSFLCSEDLTENDEEIICGLYIVDTEVEKVKAFKSWWPTNDKWVVSNKDAGWWTEDNEVWYQRRLQAIKSGEAFPMGSSDWAAHLRQPRNPAHTFFKRVDSLGEDVFCARSDRWPEGA